MSIRFHEQCNRVPAAKGSRRLGINAVAQQLGCKAMTATVEEAMNALEKNVAVARGEALAASLLASAAIQTLLAMVANREEFLTAIEAFIDGTLNLRGPGGGDANDEPNTLMRETAR